MQRPRGTRDFTPAAMKRRLALEHLLEDVAQRHGFSRVQTPVFESLELFTAKSGPGVIGQLYAFQDKGERDLTLRPELTAPVMRMVAEEMRMDTKPLRLSYYGQCYRYEEFKTGRYREFFQYGVELIGASGPLAEAEVIALAVNMLHATGLEGWEVRIGHVGVLKDALTGLGLSSEVDASTGEPPVASAMRLLDKGDDAGLAALFEQQGLDPANAEPLRALASLEGGRKPSVRLGNCFRAWRACPWKPWTNWKPPSPLLQRSLRLPLPLAVDLTVARGLDYYTGTVFEVKVDELGGEGQVLGGGSYKLLHLFGLPDLDPCCGFGLGFDRVLLALEAQAEAAGRAEAVPGEADGRPFIAVAPNKTEATPLLPLVAALRAEGARVELLLSSKNYGRIIKWTEGIGASHLLVVTSDDIEKGEGRLINFTSGDRIDVALDAEAVLKAL